MKIAMNLGDSFAPCFREGGLVCFSVEEIKRRRVSFFLSFADTGTVSQIGATKTIAAADANLLSRLPFRSCPGPFTRPNRSRMIGLERAGNLMIRFNSVTDHFVGGDPCHDKFSGESAVLMLFSFDAYSDVPIIGDFPSGKPVVATIEHQRPSLPGPALPPVSLRAERLHQETLFR